MADRSRVQFDVQGMSCGHCVAAVRRALEAVPGVAVDSVDVGRVVVSAETAGGVQAAADAIRESGYRPTLASEPAQSGAGRGGCCGGSGCGCG